jgi:hypothetical protein
MSMTSQDRDQSGQESQNSSLREELIDSTSSIEHQLFATSWDKEGEF